MKADFQKVLHVFFISGLCVSAAACNSSHVRASVMQTQSASSFPEHPGNITEHYLWNKSTKVEKASEVPDNIRFIYFDASQQETSDTAHAASRVPVLDIDIVSTDKNGKLIDPTRASRYEMTYYGPDHRFLRHTTAVANR